MKCIKNNEQKIKHQLNEAIRNCMEILKIKYQERMDYDTTLDSDYEVLYDTFIKHLERLKKWKEWKE